MSDINFDEVEKETVRIQVELLNSLDPNGPPEELFHYTTALGLHGILTEMAIWATDVSCMNDASEGTYAHGVALAVLRSREDSRSSGRFCR